MKTPLDVDTHQRRSAAAQLADGTARSTPVKAWSVTHANSEQSDDDVVVFQNSSCLVKDEGGIDDCVSADDPEERLLSASTDNFATDRVTAVAVNDPDYLPAEAVEHEGLVNKWPFESEQKTYPYWDGLIGAAVDAEFDRTDGGRRPRGLRLHGRRSTTRRSRSPRTCPGTYDDDKEIWVEPLTGAIVNQVDHQEPLQRGRRPGARSSTWRSPRSRSPPTSRTPRTTSTASTWSARPCR